MTLEKFKEELKKISINITDLQLEQLDLYYQMLIEYNSVMNLTAITEKQEVYLKHFYDSATLIKIIDLSKEETLCDVGTGAGFPGLVLKILYPNLNVTLVDSLNKRINFLNQVIEKLNLKDITTVHARCEDYAKEHREKFDIVTSRAVAHLSPLLEFSIPLVKVGKYFIPMKGKVETELLEIKEAIKILDVELVETKEFVLPEEKSQRTILKFKKLKKTNKKYPRRFGEIKKKHL